MSSECVEVVHVGLGPIGRDVLTFLGERDLYRSVAAIDVDPALVGRRLNEFVECRAGTGDVRIVNAVEQVKPASDGAIAIHCAGSSLQKTAPTLMALMDAGYHVVSTCEELANPWVTQPELTAELDQAARVNNVVLLGTGVNPGFAMDYLAVALAASQRSVRSASIHRVQDAGQRRLALQQKVGAGLTIDEFRVRVGLGTIRHVGLPESARIVDRALSLGCDEFTEAIEPIIAASPVPIGTGEIEPGRVLGIDQLVLGKCNGTTLVRLHLQMAVGLDDPRDVVTLDGEPGLESTIRGLHGDVATAAVVVNTLGRLKAAQRGLRTVDEIAASPLHL